MVVLTEHLFVECTFVVFLGNWLYVKHSKKLTYLS